MARGTSNPDYDPTTGDYVAYSSGYDPGSASFSGADASIVEGTGGGAGTSQSAPATAQASQPSTWSGTSGGGGGGTASASTSSPADWHGFPQEYINELTSMEHQWQVDTGFLVPISDDQLIAMAKKGVLTESDFGQFMAGQMTKDQQKQIPWGMFGMTKDNYIAAISGYAQSFKELTGKDLDLNPGGTGTATGEASDFGYISQFLNKGLSSSQFASALQQDQKIRDTYGWVKFGYNFTQFQNYKVTQAQYLGTTMDDKQALLQLQYRHTNQGSSMSAVAQTPLPGLPSPKTLTLEGSVAR